MIHRPPPGRVVYTLLDGPEIPKTRSESGRVCIITDKARAILVGGGDRDFVHYYTTHDNARSEERPVEGMIGRKGVFDA